MSRSLTQSVAFAICLSICPALSGQAHPVPPSTIMPPTRFTTVFGQKIAYYDYGQGPVLVLIHGSGTSAEIDWGQDFMRFTNKYRTIAIDLIGYGDSDKPALMASAQTHVNFIAEFMRQIGIKHFYLDGESMGGDIVSLYAIRAANDPTLPQVDKLVLSDPGTPVPMTKTDEERRKTNTRISGAGLTAESPAAYKDGLNQYLFVDQSYATDAYALDVWKLNLRYNYRPVNQPVPGVPAGGAPGPIRDFQLSHLKDIKVPTLIVWGEQDKLIPVDHSDYIHQQIAGSKLWIEPQAGHAVGMEKPELYVNEVEAFLDGQ